VSRVIVFKNVELFQVLGVWSTSYIPRGTRFGPLVGDIYAKDAVPPTANRKYFWRVSISSSFFFNVSVVGACSGSWNTKRNFEGTTQQGGLLFHGYGNALPFTLPDEFFLHNTEKHYN